jgi:hypothetical protein
MSRAGSGSSSPAPLGVTLNVVGRGLTRWIRAAPIPRAMYGHRASV